ncbi:MAG: helix-turn-helix domain-containing protein [Clostridiales bacterium]|nr:helix-turn-helix domain-containing protein [Clostridiales bacterium]
MYFNENEFRQRLKHLRKVEGISQEQLAAELNMSRSHLSHIEAGEKIGSVDFIVAVAEYFQVSLDYLILGKEKHSDRVKHDLRRVIKTLQVIESEL